MDIGRDLKLHIVGDVGQPVMLDVVEWRNADGSKADFGPWPAFSDSFPDSITFRFTVDPDEPNGLDDWFSKASAAFWGLPKAPRRRQRNAARAGRRGARRRQRLARRITRRAVKR